MWRYTGLGNNFQNFLLYSIFLNCCTRGNSYTLFVSHELHTDTTTVCFFILDFSCKRCQDQYSHQHLPEPGSTSLNGPCQTAKITTQSSQGEHSWTGYDDRRSRRKGRGWERWPHAREWESQESASYCHLGEWCCSSQGRCTGNSTALKGVFFYNNQRRVS